MPAPPASTPAAAPGAAGAAAATGATPTADAAPAGPATTAAAATVKRGGELVVESRELAVQLLRSMGVTHEQALRFPSSLSGGQRQRVSVARALAPQPRVLVADEPTSATDQSAQAHLLNLLRQIQLERGLTIIFISHNLGLVRYLTTRVYIMQGGQVVETGSTAEIFEHPRHAYTHLLINSMPGRR